MFLKQVIDSMFKRPPSLPLGVKFTLALLGICLVLLLLVVGILAPKMKEEQFKTETHTIERLLSKMEHQVRLAIKVNQFHSSSQKTNNDLRLQNHLQNLHLHALSHPSASLEQWIATLDQEFQGEACRALLIKENQILHSTKPLPSASPLLSSLTALPQGEWHSYLHPRPQGACPTSDKETLLFKPLGTTGYRVGVHCQSQDFISERRAFESEIGVILKESFQSIKEGNPGFAYMMWVDGSERTCDHNATLRTSLESEASLYNRVCCVSETSPTDQPLTGDLKAADYLRASTTQEPLRHWLDKEDDRGNLIHPAITWARKFETPAYPLILAVTLYEEEIYDSLGSVLLKLLPAILAALLGSLFLGILLFRRFTQRLTLLSQTAKTVKSGDLSARSHIRGEDEIGVLGETLDSMIETLEQDIQTLDSKVLERTQALESLLEEKEALLKEVHHRVKNNLAVIIALIALKTPKATSEESKTLLVELEERIYTIELLHRKLYQSKNLKRIEMKEYIQEIVHRIGELHETERLGIRIALRIEPLELDVSQALACGLLVNEALTNSLKHAFKKRGGEILILFNPRSKECHLRIEDDGVGFPKAFFLGREETLGMQLMQGIAKNQLQGRMECSNPPQRGARVDFYFPL